MAVKARNRKKQNMINIVSSSRKIACKYCELCGKCKTQGYKEKSEEMGITTYCSLTPNKEKSKNKKEIRNNKNN